MIAWVVRSFLSHRRQQRFMQLQSELHNKVLERFDTAEEALAYLSSSAGQTLLSATPAVDRGGAHRRVLGSLQIGIVLMSVGFAFLVLKEQIPDPDADVAFVFFGVLGCFLGLGFLAASAIGYLLSKHWGLFETSVGGSDTATPTTANAIASSFDD